MKAARKPERRRRFRGIFVVPKDRMLNAPDSEGGLGQKTGTRRDTSTFSYLFHSAVFAFYSSDSPVPIQGNRGGRERPPRKAGGHVAPIAALVGHASIRPHAGSLSSLLIPAGRLKTAPQWAAETTETDP